jgi:hypothetical protein
MIKHQTRTLRDERRRTSVRSIAQSRYRAQRLVSAELDNPQGGQ